jgi:hypothetical protein
MLLGVVLAVLAVPAHRHGSTVAGTTLPWGLLLSLVTVCWCGIVLRGWELATVGIALGWAALLLVLLPGGSGGDYVFVNDLRGWGLVAGGLVVAVALLAAGAGRQGNAG